MLLVQYDQAHHALLHGCLGDGLRIGGDGQGQPDMIESEPGFDAARVAVYELGALDLPGEGDPGEITSQASPRESGDIPVVGWGNSADTAQEVLDNEQLRHDYLAI